MAEVELMTSMLNLGGIGVFAWVVYRQGEKNGDRLERMVAAMESNNRAQAVAVQQMGFDHTEIKNRLTEVDLALRRHQSSDARKQRA